MIHRMLMAGIIMLGLGSMTEVATAAGRSASPLTLARPGVSTPHPAQNLTPPRSFPGGPFARSRFEHRPQQFPLWGWGYPPYGVSAYPSEYTAPIESGTVPYVSSPPFENFSERARPPVFYQPGCRTDVQRVPSTRGGEQTITVTRCY